MNTIELRVPEGFTLGTARSSRSDKGYAVLDGIVTIGLDDLDPLLEAGFNFADPLYAALFKAARKVNLVRIVASRDLTVADVGDMLYSDLGGAATLTIPLNLPTPVGSIISITRMGAGALAIAAVGGVTLVGNTTLTSTGSVAQLLYFGNNTWLAFGSLS